MFRVVRRKLGFTRIHGLNLRAGHVVGSEAHGGHANMRKTRSTRIDDSHRPATDNGRQKVLQDFVHRTAGHARAKIRGRVIKVAHLL
jgi:hypothetical protein